jgi:hypothetical protein
MVFKKLNKHDTINWVWFSLRVGQQDRCGQFARGGLNGFLGCGISRVGCAVASLASRDPHFALFDYCLMPSLPALENGSLVAPFQTKLTLNEGYYLLPMAQYAETPAAVAFRDWLFLELSSD